MTDTDQSFPFAQSHLSHSLTRRGQFSWNQKPEIIEWLVVVVGGSKGGK